MKHFAEFLLSQSNLYCKSLMPFNTGNVHYVRVVRLNTDRCACDGNADLLQ